MTARPGDAPAAGTRPTCTVCRLPRDPVLARREPHHTTHPACDPEAERARADEKRARTRAGADAARAAARGRNTR